MLKFTIRKTNVVNVTFDVFNDKGTAYTDDGRTFPVDRLEYEKMLWDIKKKGVYVLEEKEYTGCSFWDLIDSIYE